MTIDQIKAWVVKKSTVTNPYGKYWSASVTLGGMDINGRGPSIEKAYQDLTFFIERSEYYYEELSRLTFGGRVI